MPPLENCSDVPTNKEQLGEVNRRLDTIENALGLRPKVKGWFARRWDWIVNNKGTSVILALILCVISIVGGGKYKYYLDHQYDDFDNRVDKRIGIKFDVVFPPVTSKLTELGERMARVEGKLDVLSARVSITDSAQYIKRGEFTLAVKAAEEAHRALHEATVSKAPATPEFFKQVSDVINSVSPRQPELSTKFYQLRVGLATYRSAINPAPSLPKQSAELPTTGHTFTLTMALYPASTSIVLSPPKPVVIEGNGAGIDCTSMKPGQEIFIPATRSLDQNPVTVRDLILVGATQTLDYITWENITFINTHIKYLGGSVRLRNVSFVNCTFDLPSNNSGQQVAKYAALEPKQELRIG